MREAPVREATGMFDVSKVREDFPILSRLVHGQPLVYLDNAATSQKPRSVINSLVDYYERYNSNVHRGVHTLSMEATDAMEEARQKVADFIKAETPESIIWTRNTTEAINLVANTWAREHIKPGDEIVLTAIEHHSNLVPWQRVAAETGGVLRFLPLGEDGNLDLSDVDSIITPRTRLLSMVHMSNSLGTINPVKELGSRARAVGAAVMIDGAQSVPHLPVDVSDLDCDFLAFSGHKMLGPTGIGVLYVKRDVLERMEPFLTGGEMVLEVSYDRASWNDLPMRFEAGTPNIADAIGLGAAIDYLDALGMENVREHEV
jgi:cysteine desulfurase/selenocysteine lyase